MEDSKEWPADKRPELKRRISQIRTAALLHMLEELVQASKTASGNKELIAGYKKVSDSLDELILQEARVQEQTMLHAQPQS